MSDRCPFIDPEYMLDVNTPCPVCGILGLELPEIEDHCVGDIVDTHSRGDKEPELR